MHECFAARTHAPTRDRISIRDPHRDANNFAHGDDIPSSYADANLDGDTNVYANFAPNGYAHSNAHGDS